MNQDDPILLGRCTNLLNRAEQCGRRIYDDSDYQTIPSGLICEPCVNGLLSPAAENDFDSQGKPILRGKGKVQRRSAVSSFGRVKTVRAA